MYQTQRLFNKTISSKLSVVYTSSSSHLSQARAIHMNILSRHNVALSLVEFALSFPHPYPIQPLPLCWPKGLATLGHCEQGPGNLSEFKII